ncbi:hypothetical protein PFICI_02263 [Pestalotiopsis fici W106-1]|uniref:Zn(2)-C6 fungal-type domain-containing protein n=1 Tax=Pestalotiopsis fici (strain W106-1 / CGMCC3.15140) TaxID=1229662 RepID=W3XDT9_PESFW|nr:uncharacterized protein PFICI_02263 [Pestalotiopsis fici W106-1]ETS84238.1 hypothetical protein PFICI_02263 [Pestalotiopsis fici W106-1]
MLPNVRSPRNRAAREPQRIRTGPRMMVACINCKERKLRCDNQIPACANCQRFNLTCLVEDPITKRQQPRNYIEILENRNALLEGLLQQARPELTQDQLAHTDLPDCAIERTPAPSSSYLQSEVEAASQPDTTQALDDDTIINELASKVGMLEMNVAGREPHYLGSSSAFAFSRAIGSSLLLQGLQKLPDGNRQQPTSRPPHEDDFNFLPCLLPDYGDGIALSNAYFRSIHPQYPFLDKATFKVWESEVLKPDQEFSSQNPDALYFVYMVYAVGALLVPRLGYSSELLYKSSQLYVDFVLQKDNLYSIQALLCSAMYSLRSTTGPSLWKLSGLALRQCIELGYHRNAKRVGSSTDPLQLELRKRAFWCAFTIDCSMAITLGRPLGIPHQEIDVEYPIDVNESSVTSQGVIESPRNSCSDPATSMSVAIHVFRLRRLWAAIHTSLFSDTALIQTPRLSYDAQVQKLRSELESWRSSAPPVANQDQALSLFGQEDWYEVNYSYSLLLLHRRQLTSRKKEIPNQVILECLQAAENICSRYRRQYVGGSVGYTWGAIHFLFLAGLTYLHCLWISPAARASRRHDTVSSTCTDCTMVLVVMAERWAGASPYRDIFETLSKRTMTMMINSDVTRSAADGSLGGMAQDPWVLTQSVMDLSTDSIGTTYEIEQTWWAAIFGESTADSLF